MTTNQVTDAGLASAVTADYLRAVGALLNEALQRMRVEHPGGFADVATVLERGGRIDVQTTATPTSHVGTHIVLIHPDGQRARTLYKLTAGVQDADRSLPPERHWCYD